MKKKEIKKLITKTIKEQKEKKIGEIKIEINNIKTMIQDIEFVKKIDEKYIPNNDRELNILEKAINRYKKQLELEIGEL